MKMITVTRQISVEDLRAEWVKALRSGKYKQGKKLLRSIEDAFCCLGVLCDLCGLWGEPGDTCYTFKSSGGQMPLELWTAMGFYNEYASIHWHEEARTWAEERKLGTDGCLAAANDSGSWTFNDIADFVEKFPECIFREV
jgi:hypothetical protein